MDQAANRPGRGSAGRPPLKLRVIDWLRSHPVFCLFLLTPGIPEYLGGSSPLAGIVTAPGAFCLFLLLNAGLYTTGVLLIREATLRWGKGWPTVLLLGTAYGILEEGVALSTLFNPRASVVGGFGFYGHWMGVSWVWAAGVLLVHVIFSVSLPIFLLGAALPQTRGRPLVQRPGLLLALGVLGGDVLLLLVVTRYAAGFWMGTPLLLLSLSAIALLVLSARFAPRSFPHLPLAGPAWGARRCAVLGALLFPGVLVAEALAGAVDLPPALLLLGLTGLYLTYLGLVLWQLSGAGREREQIALACGLLLPLLVFGSLSQLRVPVVLVAALLFSLFFRHLFRRYPAPRSSSPWLGRGAIPSA